MSLRETIRRSVPTGPSDDASDTPWGRLLRSAAATERDLWLVVVGAMLVDITLTVHGRQLGLVEVNPVARQALDAVGVLGLYGLKSVALAMGACCRLLVGDRYGPLVPIGLAIPSLAAVCINTAIIAVVVL